MLNQKINSELLGGVLTDYKTSLAGKYRGYYTSLNVVSGMWILEINASSETDPSNANLYTYLQTVKEKYSKTVSSITTGQFSIQITFKQPAFLNKVPGMVNPVAEEVVNKLIQGGYATGCWSCGTAAETVEHYVVNGSSYFLCPQCANEFERTLKNRQTEVKAQKSRAVSGLVGAFLGGLIGVILWIGIYRLGYIAGIAGLVTVICAMKGYELLGGCLDKKGVLLSTVMSLALIYLANHISWSWAIYDVFVENNMGWTFGEIFGQLHYILEQLEASGSFWGDMAMGVFLSIVASVVRIISAFKQSSGSYTMEKK